MNADRSRAYTRVLQLVDGLAASKLHTPEQDAIRDAADALLFSTDMARDDDARAALRHLDDVVERLVATERIMPGTGETILEAVEACGPQRLAA
jgi:hypothetical protein